MLQDIAIFLIDNGFAVLTSNPSPFDKLGQSELRCCMLFYLVSNAKEIKNL